MESLGTPDAHHLSAAVGWIELGNLTEAKVELAKIAPEHLDHTGVLEVSWSISAAEQDWQKALKTAERLVELLADRPVGWLHRAYAIRRAPGGGLDAAWNALRPAADRFPKDPTIAYNLACYACQMGKLDEARDWLRRAVAAGEKAKIKAMASADCDLQALWGEVKGL